MKKMSKAARDDYEYKYKRTPKGYLVRLYPNLKKRSEEKCIPYLNRAELYEFGLGSEVYMELHKKWVESGCEHKLAPSVDRIDKSKGYTLDNMQWLTVSENSKKWHKTVNAPRRGFKVTVIIEEE